MNKPDTLPVLYSFRRCPYAIRARMALLYADQQVQLREVWLRHKPKELILLSPKATVPVLVLADGTVLEESLEIMLWALGQNDPKHILPNTKQGLTEMLELIEINDTEFKAQLDGYKYAGKEQVKLAEQHRAAGFDFLQNLDVRLQNTGFLFGQSQSVADLAIFPFVRQFAGVNQDWFTSEAPKTVQNWLQEFVQSPEFSHVMQKLEFWTLKQTPSLFPQNENDLNEI